MTEVWFASSSNLLIGMYELYTAVLPGRGKNAEGCQAKMRQSDCCHVIVQRPFSLAMWNYDKCMAKTHHILVALFFHRLSPVCYVFAFSPARQKKEKAKNIMSHIVACLVMIYFTVYGFARYLLFFSGGGGERSPHENLTEGHFGAFLHGDFSYFHLQNAKLQHGTNQPPKV